MENEEIFKKRVAELARKCFERGVYTHTSFLNMMETELFYSMSREIGHVPFELYGGRSDSERRVLRFGSEEFLGYAEEFPISCLRIEPLQEKFAQELTHRDFLGALMNIGIERGMLGDIFVEGKSALLYCMSSMAEYISTELTRVRHTPVRCMAAEANEGSQASPEPVEKSLSVSSERVDAVISKLYNLSRTESNALFAAQRVFINSRLQTGNAVKLKMDDVVSVRGYGRFIYKGVGYVNKKGKNCVKILKY